MIGLLLTAALAADPPGEPAPEAESGAVPEVAGATHLRWGRTLAVLGAAAVPAGATSMGLGLALARVSPDAPDDSFELSLGDGMGMVGFGLGTLPMAAAPPLLATGTTLRAVGLREAGCGGSAAVGWVGIGASAAAVGLLYVPVLGPDGELDGARLVAAGAGGASLGAGLVQAVLNRRVERRCGATVIRGP